MARTWSRWLPAAAVPLVVAGSVAFAAQAGADELPERTPEDVLTLLADRDHQPFSGEFEQTSDLGLPQLPGGVDLPDAGGDAAAVTTALEALTSDHNGRVFVGEQDQARLQVFESFGERDVIVNGEEVWVYDSGENAATHATIPSGADGRAATTGQQLTPDEVADQVIEAVSPSSELSVRENVEVAGRAAYDLVVTPRTDATLVGEVAIAVDGETGQPLRVSVTARGEDAPAFQIGYTSLDLTAPDADLFEFTPPAGAEVEEIAPSSEDRDAAHHPEPTVVGTGWESVAIIEAGGGDITNEPLLVQLTTAVDGGRLLGTDLVNVLIADDGRVLVGAVPLERLQAAAAG
jgi:outer membrane lipoprotein-sorting protein